MQQIDTRRSDESSEVRWWNIESDTRGVSEVLGAILVFALVLAVLVLMQVAAVPAANQQVEFEHDQAVQEDLQDVRTAIIDSVGSGGVEAATVRLGVRYPPRLFLLNPGPVAGTLRTNPAGKYSTTNADPLDLKGRCGTDDLGTKHLRYQIDYNEYQGRSISTVENTFVAQKYENSEEPLVKNRQVLVRGNTISIFIIKGNASYSRVTKESINFISGGTGTFHGQIDDPWTLQVPTTLDASEWRKNSNLLQSELDSNPEPPASAQDDKYVTSVDSGTGSTIDITFEGGKEYTVRCTVVGINEDPGTNPTDDPIPPPDEGLDINPNHPGTITQERAVLSGCSDEDSNNQVEVFWDTCRVRVTFKNRDDVVRNFTALRVNFYKPDQAFKTKGNSPFAKRPSPEEFRIEGQGPGEIGGPFITVDLTNAGEIAPDQTQTYTFRFLLTDPSDNQVKTYNVVQGDYFILTAILDDGSTETYFVGPQTDTGFKPTAEITSATVSRSGNKDTITVGWKAEDIDGDLQSGSITVAEVNGPKSASTTISPSGNADSGTESLTITQGPNTGSVEYLITLTVEDAKGNTVTVTKTVSSP